MREIVLIKRCLTHRVKILPYQLEQTLEEYEKYKIPDEVLNKLSSGDLQKYVEGLYYSSLEMAGDWTRGHNLLKELGFKEVERREGHRTFVSLKY